jgi:hypothetical protein
LKLGGSEDPWTTGRSVAGVLRNHVDLEYEAIDRMYLNLYVPHLQTVRATVGYLRVHKGQLVCVDDGGSADDRCVRSQHQAIRRYRRD